MIADVLPVVEDNAHNKLIGVITDRDIACRAVAEGKNPLDLTAKDIMTSKVYTVTPKTSVEDCCNLMEEKQIRRVAVIDDNGCCCGMVAQADIARCWKSTNCRSCAKGFQRISKFTRSLETNIYKKRGKIWIFPFLLFIYIYSLSPPIKSAFSILLVKFIIILYC